MKAIYALFPDPGSAQNAFDALRRAGSSLGIDAGKIVVVTSEPFEGYDFSVEHAKKMRLRSGEGELHGNRAP